MHTPLTLRGVVSTQPEPEAMAAFDADAALAAARRALGWQDVMLLPWERRGAAAWGGGWPQPPGPPPPYRGDDHKEPPGLVPEEEEEEEEEQGDDDEGEAPRAGEARVPAKKADGVFEDDAEDEARDAAVDKLLTVLERMTEESAVFVAVGPRGRT